MPTILIDETARRTILSLCRVFLTIHFNRIAKLFSVSLCIHSPFFPTPAVGLVALCPPDVSELTGLNWLDLPGTVYLPETAAA